jgi:hypothetical protein
MDKVAQDRTYAFKVGFLTKLASMGVTPQQFFEGVKKADLDVVNPLISSGTRLGEQAISSGADLGATGLKYLAGLGVVAPIALGAGAGVGKTLLDAPTAGDIDTLQQAELAALYKRLASEIRERNKHKVLA